MTKRKRKSLYERARTYACHKYGYGNDHKTVKWRAVAIYSWVHGWRAAKQQSRRRRHK